MYHIFNSIFAFKFQMMYLKSFKYQLFYRVICLCLSGFIRERQNNCARCFVYKIKSRKLKLKMIIKTYFDVCVRDLRVK